jgi:hypothetical protein
MAIKEAVNFSYEAIRRYFLIKSSEEPTCLTYTFPISWTNTLSGQPQPCTMLTEEYPSAVSPGALLWVLP